MGDRSAEFFSVKLPEGEVHVQGLDALRRLVEDGKVRAATPIRLAGATSWTPAAQVEGLAPLLRSDPWSAWEDLDKLTDSDWMPAPPEPPPAARAKPIHSEPSRSSTPGDRPSTRRKRDEPPRPQPDRAPVSIPHPSPRATTGKVIAFPTQRTTSPTERAAALAPAEPVSLPRPRPLPRRAPGPAPPPPRKPRTRWGPLAMLALGGAIALGLVRWYVVSTATAVYPAHPTPAGPATPSSPPATRPPPSAASPPAPGQTVDPNAVFAEMEAELRGRLRPEVKDIRAPGDLEDALLLELGHLRLDVMSVDAEVLEWIGRKHDVPKVADITIRLRSRPGDLDREVAGAALAAGKYIQLYDLTVPRLVVVFNGVSSTPLQRDLDATLARRFYEQRIDLVTLLRSLK